MWTADRMDGNSGFTERTFFLGLFFYFFLCMQMGKFVDLTDQKKDHKADNKEVDQLCDKCAIIDRGSVVPASQDDLEIVKIDLPGKDAEQRHKDVIYQ